MNPRTHTYTFEGDTYVFTEDYPDDFILSVIKSRGFYELDLLRKVESLVQFDENALILDLGANRGNHSIYFGKRHPEVSIIAVEASTEISRVLTENIRLNGLRNVRVVQQAVSNVEGSEYGVVHNRRANIGGSYIVPHTDGAVCGVTTTVDCILENSNLHLRFVKIDCENHDAQVLEGAIESIKRWQPLVSIEMWKQAHILKYGLTDPRDIVLPLFESIGYTLLETLSSDNYLFGPKDSTS